MTEPRTDHRVTIVKCGHEVAREEYKRARRGLMPEDSSPEADLKRLCSVRKRRGECPDKECMGWVD